MDYKIDKSQWSKSSQKSSGGHYDAGATHYENIAYRCVKCFAASIFSAEEQKHSYEVRKDYIWRIPTLCANCVIELTVLREQDNKFLEQWNIHKETLNGNLEFLTNWLHTLNEISKFGKPYNQSAVTMLSRLVDEVPNQSFQRTAFGSR